MTQKRATFPSAAVAAVATFLALTLAVADASRLKHFHRAPIIDLSGAEELIGLVREDERVVTVSPQLRVLRETGPICRYELSRADGAGGDLPFESHVLDKTEGIAQIRVRAGSQVDCSAGEFRLQLVAVRCADNTARSEPVTLKITVKDTNNHAPAFEAPWYSFDVDDGKTGEIARLYATDEDCGHPYGRVCRYEITNTMADSAFRIDDQGALSAIRPLNASHAESHLLTLVAHDCGMLASKSTLVTVHVRAKCVDGIVAAAGTSGAEHRLPVVRRATAGAETPLIPDADIALCPREPMCTVKSAETEITLATVPALAAISAESPKRCGLSSATVDLLPDSSAPTTVGTSPTPTDDDEDEEEEGGDNATAAPAAESDKHFFDGKDTAITVPSSAVSSVIPQKFTLSFAMKHEARTTQEQAVKQNILCETDDFAMNRHHFAVYVRHCKLELLLRREAAGAKAEFRAAEWRWEAPGVCDGRWHAYAIRFVDLDNVELFVDGRAFGQTDRNPEILDDWPLHDTKQHKTRLVVGACWHGRNAAMVQHFRGHLARMFLWSGGAETPAALRCLHGERDKLTFGAIDRLVPGESIVTDKTQSKLTLKAASLKNLAALLRSVKFETSAGSIDVSRRFTACTHVVCAEANRTISLGEYAARVDIVAISAAAPSVPSSAVSAAARQPQLSIGGQTLLTVERRHLKTGAPLMPNIQLVVTQPSADGIMDKDVTAEHQLDWCKLHLKPSRDMDLEYFSSPAALISFLNVDFEHDKQGIMLNGKESVKNYADVLSKIRYYNTRPDTYSKRVYTVQCAMMGGKILSNELFVQMDIVHNEELEDAMEKLVGLSNKLNKHALPTPASAAATDGTEILKLEKHFEPSSDQLGSNRLQNILEMDLPRPKAFMGSHHGYEMGQGAVAGGAVAVVVVICIGFLLVLLVIGVLKMRDSPLPSRRTRRSRKPTMEGMEWDDNGMGMNITINPLMDVNKSQRDGVAGGLDSASIYASDAEDDDDSLEDEYENYREEDELTDDDEEDVESGGCRSEHIGSATGGTLLPHAHDAGGKQRLEWDDCTLADALPPTRGARKNYHV